MAAPDQPFVKPWMPLVLRLAAIYNLVWGGAAVVFPVAMLRVLGAGEDDLAGMAVPLWQGVGMIIGVYGVGYWIAATAPTRHWPIVLVGLLGKVFGPIGVIDTVFVRGTMPIAFFWTNITNDLIWIVPFGLILLAAYQRFVAERAGAFGELDDNAGTDEGLRSAMERVTTSAGRSLADAVVRGSDDGPVLVVFLRHLGCTFCREAVADLSQARGAIEARGTRIVLVHMTADLAHAGARFERSGLGGIEHAGDPEKAVYRAFGLAKGTLGQLFGPGVWARGIDAGLVQRHFIGALEGDGFQMPGVFLVDRGRVVRAYRHRDAGDRPDYDAIACPTDG